jgi:hypothetical protein
MTLDVISGRAELAIVILALIAGIWTFMDTDGVARLLVAPYAWWPWHRPVPTVSRWLLLFVKWDAGLVAVGAALVLLAHLFHW